MSSVIKPSLYDFFAYLDITTDYEIEELGDILSKELFDGKYNFGGKEEYLRDEVPAIYFNDAFLGLTVFLEGYPGLYNFKISTPYESSRENATLIDLSNDFLIRINALNNPDIRASLGDDEDDPEENEEMED